MDNAIKVRLQMLVKKELKLKEETHRKEGHRPEIM